MKHWIIASAVALASVGAQAGAGYMLGVVHNFGGSTGITFKVLSSDKKDRGVAAVGLSYFPRQASPLGFDVGLGYTFKNGVITGGYDFLSNKPQLGIGLSNTKDRSVAPAPAPPTALSAALGNFN